MVERLIVSSKWSTDLLDHVIGECAQTFGDLYSGSLEPTKEDAFRAIDEARGNLLAVATTYLVNGAVLGVLLAALKNPQISKINPQDSGLTG